ncbi:MAG TPA: response regulator [Bryobacteraceae bacterium]|nr:response regulator [Bryobacteraceae bacterium]
MVRVLLVEDNIADVELVREALDASGLRYVLDVAADFEFARNCIEGIGDTSHCPDVILMDLNLPKGSGWDLLRILRAHPKGGKVPVVVVSSSNSPSDRMRAPEFGVADYFRKPADIDEFMKLGPLIKEILARPASDAPAGRGGAN